MKRPDLERFAREHRGPIVAGCVLLVLYALAGFFLVPWILDRGVVGYFRDTLGLQASVERLRTNPFTFTLEANGFAVRETGGAELLGFDRLLVNFQLSSLFRWAWTFEEVRLVGPRVDVIVEPDGSLNLRKLVPAAEEPAQVDAGESDALPRVLVHRLAIDAARAGFEDRTRPTPFRTAVGPGDLELQRFSTLPGKHGDFAIDAEAESGARFSWRGTLGVDPPRSEGRIELRNGHLPVAKRYLQDVLNFDVPDGRAEMQLGYELSYEGGELRGRVREGSVTVHDLVVTTREDRVEVLRLPEARIAGTVVEWPERKLAVEAVTLSGVRLAAWRNADGSINLLRTLAEQPAAGTEAAPVEPQDATASAATAETWSLSLGRLALEDLAASIEDRTIDPPFRTGLTGLSLEVREIDSAAGATFPFELAFGIETGGAFSADGKLGVLPALGLDAAIKLDGLALVALQPYLDELARLRIDSGLVSLDGKLISDTAELMRYRGSTVLADLACHDVKRDERLVAVGRLHAADLLLELTAARLRVASVDLERPYGRLTIYEDATTNVGDLFAAQPVAGAEAIAVAPDATATEAPLQIEIGEVRIRDGSADFADLSLPLPFASRVESLAGGISEMSTGGTSARVELEGTVDEYGMARVDGSLDFFAPDRRSDVAVTFRNVEMKRLSPYSSKFAGYTIEDGRLSLDLRYVLEDRRLDSQNDILVERLTLGEKVESPDAPNLPVKLAVALLKDKNGNIELDIPVGGTLDDPEFAYGKLVWQAIRNVLSKIATAPFRALARLVGSDKDLERIEFAAANSSIVPPARETLEQIARALAERSELVLEVGGVFDPDLDAAGIREAKLEALVAEHVGPETPVEGSAPVLASERTRAALEAIFLARFPREELDGLVASHTASPAPAAEGVPASASAPAPAAPAEPVFDLARYLEALRERLEAAIPVSDEELGSLADSRAASVRQFFASDAPVPAEQIRVVDSGPIKPKDADEHWVYLRLVLSAK